MDSGNGQASGTLLSDINYDDNAQQLIEQSLREAEQPLSQNQLGNAGPQTNPSTMGSMLEPSSPSGGLGGPNMSPQGPMSMMPQSNTQLGGPPPPIVQSGGQQPPNVNPVYNADPNASMSRPSAAELMQNAPTSAMNPSSAMMAPPQQVPNMNNAPLPQKAIPQQLPQNNIKQLPKYTQDAEDPSAGIGAGSFSLDWIKNSVYVKRIGILVVICFILQIDKLRNMVLQHPRIEAYPIAGSLVLALLNTIIYFLIITFVK